MDSVSCVEECFPTWVHSKMESWYKDCSSTLCEVVNFESLTRGTESIQDLPIPNETRHQDLHAVKRIAIEIQLVVGLERVEEGTAYMDFHVLDRKKMVVCGHPRVGKDKGSEPRPTGFYAHVVAGDRDQRKEPGILHVVSHLHIPLMTGLGSNDLSWPNDKGDGRRQDLARSQLFVERLGDPWKDESSHT